MCYPLPTKLGNCRIGNVIIILLLLWSHCQKENNFRYFHPSEGISQVDQLGAGREVCLDGPEGTHQDRHQEDLLQYGQLKVAVTDVTKEILRSNPAHQYNVMIVLCFY